VTQITEILVKPVGVYVIVVYMFQISIILSD